MLRMIASKPLNGRLQLPGSKYIANRVLPMAALADGVSTIKNVPDNEDISLLIKGLTQLGISLHGENGELQIFGQAGHHKSPSPVSIYTGASGTFSRFMTSLALIHGGEVELSGTEKMNSRPMKDLLTCLEENGLKPRHHHYCLPLNLKGPLPGGTMRMKGDVSSQYFSSILIAAPFAQNPVRLSVDGALVSRPYVDLTLSLMKHFGLDVHEEENAFWVPQGHYRAREYRIEADPVSSTYPMAAALLTKGEIEIEDFNADSVQGEAGFYQLLQKMGARVEINEDCLKLSYAGPLQGLGRIDMGAMPDAVPTMAVLAALAEGPTEIVNIGHLRFKESDRIAELGGELLKAGVDLRWTEDSFYFEGKSQLKPAVLKTHKDHRLGMSLALLSLVEPGIAIEQPEVVAKSFPDYFDRFRSWGIDYKVED